MVGMLEVSRDVCLGRLMPLCLEVVLIVVGEGCVMMLMIMMKRSGNVLKCGGGGGGTKWN